MDIRPITTLAVALVAGCTFLPQPETVNTTRLRFTGEGADVERAVPTARTLLVAQPRAMQPYATPRFAYIEQDRELNYFTQNEWASDPVNMLHPVLVRALEESGRFAAVVASPTPATADVRLDLEILELHQDFRGGGQSEFVWRVRVQLVALNGRRVAGTRVFEVREPAGRDAKSGAAAADRALARLLSELTAFVAELPLD